jgi:hypothetical protein
MFWPIRADLRGTKSVHPGRYWSLYVVRTLCTLQNVQVRGFNFLCAMDSFERLVKPANSKNVFKYMKWR